MGSSSSDHASGLGAVAALAGHRGGACSEGASKGEAPAQGVHAKEARSQRKEGSRSLVATSPLLLLLAMLCALSIWPDTATAQRKTLGRVAVFQADLEKTVPLVKAEAYGGSETIEKVDKSVSSDEGPKNSNSEGWPVLLPDDVIRGHEGDLERVRLLRSMIADVAIDNMVIVVPSNLGFLDQAMNVRCRLMALNSTNLLIWALDKETSRKLDEMGVTHFYDPTLFAVSGAVGYGVSNELKGRMMSERPRVWWRILATGYDMLFLDADVVVFQPPEGFLEPGMDLQGQLDYQSQYGWGFEGMSNKSTLCAGVFWIKSSAKSLRFMDLVVASFEDSSEEKMVVYRERNRWDDQLALNYVAHNPKVAAIVNPKMRGERRADVSDDDIMRVAYADPVKVLGGTMWDKISVEGTGFGAGFSYKSEEEGGVATKFSPTVMHLNGFGMGPKVETMKQRGWWVLDDNNRCK